LCKSITGITFHNRVNSDRASVGLLCYDVSSVMNKIFFCGVAVAVMKKYYVHNRRNNETFGQKMDKTATGRALLCYENVTFVPPYMCVTCNIALLQCLITIQIKVQLFLRLQ